MNNCVILNMNDNKSFRMPSSILKQVDECSFGGFVLFSFDGDGNPQVHSKFDNSLNAMAVQQFVSNWIKAVEMMNCENTLNTLQGNYDEDLPETEDTYDPYNEDEEEL